jgi:hypothetical protein
MIIDMCETSHEIIEAISRFRPSPYFMRGIFVDRLHGSCYRSKIWGRIVGHPNGVLSIEPKP